MINRIRYLLGSIVSIPLLPLLAYQGKKVRSSVPRLEEAKNKEGSSGTQGHETKSMVFIGESTLAGVGVDFHKNGFPGAVASRLHEHLRINVSWKVYARSGYTAKKVRHALLPKIDEEKVDLFIIGLGGNDAFTLNTPWKWKSDIENIITDLKKQYPQTPIAFPNMPPIKEFPAFTPLIKFVIGNLVEIHGQELSRLSKKYSDVYYNDEIIKLDFWINKLGNQYQRSDFFSDGVHPSPLTYWEWGKDFADFLIGQNVLKA